jgi:opacity protein-like surface antigen
MYGKLTTLTCGLALLSISAFAQEEYPQYRSEVAGQALGSFVKSTTQNGITQNADHTAGALGSYRLFFDRHNGVEVSYGYTQNTEKYGASGIETNSHQVTGAYVFRFPMKRLSPFALAGAGAMIFDPKNNTALDTQARASFLYGGGADLNLSSRLFVRAEYRGSVYNSPTYGATSLNGLDRFTHRAEPTVGIGWRF